MRNNAIVISGPKLSPLPTREAVSPATQFTTKPMTFTLFAWVLVLLVFVLLLLWATESRNTRIRRLHKNGHTYAEIAKRYRVSAPPSDAGQTPDTTALRNCVKHRYAGQPRFPLGRAIII